MSENVPRIKISEIGAIKPRDADLFQLHTYALYACEKWSTDPEQIVLHAAYIGEGHALTTPVDLNRLSEAQDEMSASLREMMEVHYDPDVDDLILDYWPASPESRKCVWCRFRDLCSETAK